VKGLIVTADDFGLSPGVVAGIVEAHAQGIVTATSLMVNAPAAEEAFRLARETPALGVGLHFVLTFGAPVGPAGPLGDLLDENGRFRRLDSGVHARVSPKQVREELRAQIQLFESGVGRPPTHIDGHHHVHALPGVLRAVIDEAGPRGIAVRAIDPATRERLRVERVRTHDAFIEDFYGADVSEEALVAILSSLPEGTSELMCHPALEDDVLAGLSSYVEPRYRELRALTSPRVRETLATRGVELLLP
jgi:hypothetical protein